MIKGKMLIVSAPSGSGKSTFLHLAAGLLVADSGEIEVGGELVSAMSDREATIFRRRRIGLVFQDFNLVPTLTAAENIELPLLLDRARPDRAHVASLVETLGLGDRLSHLPSELSGGEQQRVAIARALAKNPKLLLCDEPTGALDYLTGKAILKLLQDTARNTGMTVVIITHNKALTAMADRVIRLKSGTVTECILNENVIPVENIEW